MSAMTARLPALLHKRARQPRPAVTFTPRADAVTSTRPQPKLTSDLLPRTLAALQAWTPPTGVHPLDAPLRTETERLIDSPLTAPGRLPRASVVQDARELPLLRATTRVAGWAGVLRRAPEPLPRRKPPSSAAAWDEAKRAVLAVADAAIAENRAGAVRARVFIPSRTVESAARFLHASRKRPLPPGGTREVIAAEYRLEEAIAAYCTARRGTASGDLAGVLEAFAREADSAAQALYVIIRRRPAGVNARSQGRAA